jgi:hypothetical protein
MADPSFSVVLPLYNGASHVAAALASIDRQTYSPAQVVVVDDGSDDEGGAIAAAHPVVTDVLRQANSGVAVARNVGASITVGSHLAFIDQDDMWHPRHLELIASFFIGHPTVRAVFTAARAFALVGDEDAVQSLPDDAGSMVETLVAAGDETTLLDGSADAVGAERVDWRTFLRTSVAVTNSFVYERSIFAAAGGFPIHAIGIDDHLLAANVARLVEMWCLDQRTVFYRVHAESALRTSSITLPLLTSLAAHRAGRPGSSDRSLGPLSDESLVAHELGELARRDHGGWRQALALIELLGLERQDRARLRRRVVRLATASRLRTFRSGVRRIGSSPPPDRP